MILTGESGARYLVNGAPSATGGHGIVYRAIAEDDGREVAIKVSQAPEGPGDPLAAELALAQDLAAHPMIGPHVAPIWDQGRWEDRRFAVLDWYPDTLATWGARQPLEARRAAARTLLDVVEALGRAEVVHGDLKPGNVLLRDDDPTALLLVDFGAAGARPGLVPFTRGYAPPEQVAGGAPTAAWDRFALAATVWHLLSGRPAAGVGWGAAPVLADDRDAFDRSVPGDPRLRDALEAHLEPEPERRPPDLTTLRAALARESLARPAPVALAWVAGALAAATLVLGVRALDPVVPCPHGSVGDGSGCLESDGSRLVYVPPGRFHAGRLDDARPDWTTDATPHEVALTRGLWASDAEVTQAQWTAVMGDNPVAWRTQTFEQGNTAPCATWLGESFVAPDLPVVCVSWFDAITYANARSRRDGLRPAYANEVDGHGARQTIWDRSADGWRLPTEAEWEWMARAGTHTPWVDAPERDALCAWANVRDASAPEKWGNEVACDDGLPLLAPVRRLRPNRWGLYDTLGNTLEWVWDLYGPYPDGPLVDPEGAPGGASRVLKGSSWNHVGRGVDARYAENPEGFANSLGFRVVRTAR